MEELINKIAELLYNQELERHAKANAFWFDKPLTWRKAKKVKLAIVEYCYEDARAIVKLL